MLQTAPALTPYKTLHGSQPDVNTLHPFLGAGGLVLCAPALKHSAVAQEGVEVTPNGSVD